MLSTANTPGYVEGHFNTPQYYERSGMLEIINSVYRQENIIGSTLNNLAYWNQSSGEDDPSFNPFPQIIGTKYEKYAKSFKNVRNERNFELIKAQIDQEVMDREVMAKGGMKSLLPLLIMGNLDPTFLLPGSILIKGLRKSETIFDTALATAGMTGAVVAGQETVLHATQNTRTLEESKIAIAASTLIGGLLGGGAGLLSKRGLHKVSDGYVKDMNVADENMRALAVVENKGFTFHEERGFQMVDDPQDLVPVVASPKGVEEFSAIRPFTGLEKRNLLGFRQKYNAKQIEPPKIKGMVFDMLNIDGTWTPREYAMQEFRSLMTSEMDEIDLKAIIQVMADYGFTEKEVRKMIQDAFSEGVSNG